MAQRFSIKLNNIDKIEQLLQETYDLACEQIIQIQNEISKIVTSTRLVDADIDAKEKYGKIMTNYISLQQKAIGQKFDIAKLMAEVAKHNGDISEALGDMKTCGKASLDLNKLKQLAKSVTSSADNNTNESKTYKIQ